MAPVLRAHGLGRKTEEKTGHDNTTRKGLPLGKFGVLQNRAGLKQDSLQSGSRSLCQQKAPPGPGRFCQPPLRRPEAAQEGWEGPRGTLQ